MTTYEGGSGPAPGERAQAAAGRAVDAGGEVAGTAKERARDIAEEAGYQAHEVAAEASQRARDLVGEARGQLRSQAITQRDRMAGQLRSLGDELDAMAARSDQPGPATELMRQASDRAHALAAYLDKHEPGDLLDEVRDFARRRPGLFLLGAAVAGVVAGRLTRGVAAASSGNGSRTRTTRPAAEPLAAPAAEPVGPAAEPLAAPATEPVGPATEALAARAAEPLAAPGTAPLSPRETEPRSRPEPPFGAAEPPAGATAVPPEEAEPDEWPAGSPAGRPDRDARPW